MNTLTSGFLLCITHNSDIAWPTCGIGAGVSAG
jgi:hypothetical protein